MSERRPGVPRLHHGAGVGVGHVCAEDTVHGPIVSRKPLPGPKNLAKKNSETMVHCRLGIPERRVGDGRRCACYGYAAAARRRHSREYSFSCTPGWRTVVSRADLLHGRLQLSSGTTAMLGSLSHTDVCIAQSVCSSSHQQRSSVVYNGCREAGTTARASGGLRAALIAPLFVLVLVLQRFYKPWFIYGVQFAPRVQTMVL
jgi:hypothetical protein